MADAQRAVEEIRFVMQSEVWEMTDELQLAATAYAEACRDVNARLRRCDEFLKRGLRSEAIHLAEADSNLLETVALLDFPERRDWDEALGLYAIPPPEPLRLDIAQDLNEAYVIEQPLQKWLAKHRRLALARAPLNQRLAVLRKLGSLDAESSFWEEDIREFERARLREIDAEARTAAQSLNTAALQALAKEVTETSWRDGTPKSLVSTVRQLAAQVDRHVADRGLTPLADELETAFSALDLTTARTLRDRWQNLAARTKLASTDPRAERVAPILGWVSDEDGRETADQGYRSAVAALDRALLDEVPLLELERIAHAALRFERTLPELLVSRYQNRVSALELADRRARYLKIGGVITAVLLVAGFAGVIMQRQMAADEADRVAAAVGELVAAGEFADARQLIEEHGNVSRWDSLIAAQKQLAEAESAETDRAADFQSVLGRIRNADAYETAAREVEKGGQLARTGEEKLALSELQQSWEDRHREELAAIEAEVVGKIHAASDQLLEFEELAVKQPGAAAAGELQGQLAAQLADLKHTARNLRSEVRSQIDVLASRHESAELLRQRGLRELAAVAGLTRASLIEQASQNAQAATDAYVASLKEYADSLQEQPGAERLRQRMTEQIYWTGVLEWQRLTDSWSELWPTTAEEQRTRAAECDAFIKAHPQAPDLADARTYQAALTAILVRDSGSAGESSRGQRSRLELYFSLPVIKATWMLRTKAGKAYYLLDEQDFSAEPGVKPVRLEHFIGYTRDDKDAATIKAQEFENKKPSLSPQSAIAGKVLERLPKLDPPSWEPYFLELATEIRDSGDLDAFLKFDLLKRTLETAAAGSTFLATSLKPHLAAVQTNRVDPAARWMDPDDENAKEARESAGAVLERLPDLAAAWDQAAANQRAFVARIDEPVQMIGWLKQTGNVWQCQSAWRPDGRYRLQVAYSDTAEGMSVWRQVGEASDEGISLRSGESAFLQEGRPVFAVRVAEPTAAASNP